MNYLFMDCPQKVIKMPATTNRIAKVLYKGALLSNEHPLGVSINIVVSQS